LLKINSFSPTSRIVFDSFFHPFFFSFSPFCDKRAIFSYERFAPPPSVSSPAFLVKHPSSSHRVGWLFPPRLSRLPDFSDSSPHLTFSGHLNPQYCCGPRVSTFRFKKCSPLLPPQSILAPLRDPVGMSFLAEDVRSLECHDLFTISPASPKRMPFLSEEGIFLS